MYATPLLIVTRLFTWHSKFMQILPDSRTLLYSINFVGIFIYKPVYLKQVSVSMSKAFLNLCIL